MKPNNSDSSKNFWKGLSDLSKPILPRAIPDNIKSKIVKVTSWPLAREVSIFLSKNFGNPPHTPILNIPPTELYENSAHTFVWMSESMKPIGTIRYRPWGKDNTHKNHTQNRNRTYWQVDCFCVDKKYRAQGIGSWLLKYLHLWANSNSIPYALFLKEGAPLQIPRLPFKTGIYAFSDYNSLTVTLPFSLRKISSAIAENWLNSFPLIKNKLTNIFPNDIEPNFQSFWYLYKSGTIWLIVRAEKTNQVGPTGHLGWLTNIYESPSWNTITFQQQTQHISTCSSEISRENTWGSIWIDSQWVEISEKSPWKLDGPYYFYSFQW